METRTTLPAHVEAEKFELVEPGQIDAQNENMASQQQVFDKFSPGVESSHF